ncbi:MAG: methyltransferase, partial [Mesorhizobium sp.]
MPAPSNLAPNASQADTPAHTVDAFHRGRFWLVQPRQGHRAGMDAMMLAAAVPSVFSG